MKNVLSTPTWFAILLTVNDSPLPLPRLLITTPSNPWFRTLSPSTTRTFTRTVSPELNSSILIDHLSGSLIGYLIFAIISKVGSFLYKKPVLGMGDAKLCFLLGIWLGSSGVLLSIYLTFILSGIFSVFAISIGKLSLSKPFALGPFISLSGFLVWYLGDKFLIELIF